MTTIYTTEEIDQIIAYKRDMPVHMGPHYNIQRLRDLYYEMFVSIQERHMQVSNVNHEGKFMTVTEWMEPHNVHALVMPHIYFHAERMGLLDAANVPDALIAELNKEGV